MSSITQRVVKRARRKGVKVVTRKQWAFGHVSPPVYQVRRRTRKHAPNPSDTLWLHISVTRRSDIRADMRTLHSIGMDRFGSGVSYNFPVDIVTGEIGVGQALDAKGTHTIIHRKDLLASGNWSADQNLVSHALCFIGMPGSKPSGKAVAAAGLMVAAMIQEGVLTRDFDFRPHRWAVAGTPFAKDCPTDAMVAVMDDIRRIARDNL